MLAIPIFLPLISGFVLFLLATAGHKWQEGITKKLSVAVMGIVLLNQFIWKKSGGYNLEIKRRYPALITFG